MNYVNDLYLEQKDFVLAAIHVDPDEAVEEINALDAAHDDITSHFGTDNIIILGDLNADCKYVSGRALSELTLRTDPKYVWLIDDNADTTVTTGTDCAYDRWVHVCNRVMCDVTARGSCEWMRKLYSQMTRPRTSYPGRQLAWSVCCMLICQILTHPMLIKQGTTHRMYRTLYTYNMARVVSQTY